MENWVKRTGAALAILATGGVGGYALREKKDQQAAQAAEIADEGCLHINFPLKWETKETLTTKINACIADTKAVYQPKEFYYISLAVLQNEKPISALTDYIREFNAGIQEMLKTNDGRDPGIATDCIDNEILNSLLSVKYRELSTERDKYEKYISDRDSYYSSLNPETLKSPEFWLEDPVEKLENKVDAIDKQLKHLYELAEHRGIETETKQAVR